MRYFLELSFNGSGFAGWQQQPGSPSVQAELQRALTGVLGSTVEVTGAGRTDAGVHARQMVLHFDGPDGLQLAPDAFFRDLSLLLPPAIRVQGLRPVREEAHARFDAVTRGYRYFVDRERNPFLRGLAMDYHGPLDFDVMQKGASMLTGTRDFRCFARSGSEVSHYLCSVYTSHWLEEEGVLIFEIRANRFLRNMVRAIVGTLLDIGRGRFALNALPGILASGSRSRAGTSAPAHGLFLWEVTYPREIYLESADCQSDVSGPSLSSPGLSR